MDKQTFIADFLEKNTKRGVRRRASNETALANAEKAWAAYTSPEARMTRELESKGGRYWSSSDSAKRRMYFADIHVIDEDHQPGLDDRCDVYYDLDSEHWVARGKKLTNDQVESVLLQIHESARNA